MDLSQVAKLRAATGAGMMEVKKALDEAGGDEEKAVELLRKSGALKAAKKADRATGEGVIESYVHSNGKLAVLVEVLCETDFVSRNSDFKALAHDLAMHIAAANPLYVSSDQVPPELIEKEKEIYKAELAGKPADMMEKILEGKVAKFCSDICLLDQKFLKDDSITVGEYLQQNILKIGENIVIKRFVRMALGT